MDKKKMYINGEWIEGTSGKTFQSVNPATGAVNAEVCQSSLEDTKAAIDAAYTAFYETREWRDMDAQERSDMMLKIADTVAKYKDELAMLDSIDMGKPLREAEADVDDTIYCYRYYAGLMKAPHGGAYEVNKGFGDMHCYSIHEPIGVCALITPWNYPLLMGANKLAPCLAAGNTVIYKPPTVSVLSAIKMFEIFEEVGLPKGTVNLVMGSGSVLGTELSESEKVDMVSFTGSTTVGQDIMRKAAGTVKKVSLELGGKSPNVIFADADLDCAVEWSMIGVFYNQGEVCSAGSRIIIEESIKDEFLKRFKAKAEAMTIGDPLKNPDMGSIVSEEQFNTVMSYIEKGKAEGATLVTGGERYAEGECAKGFYIRPTIFDNCTPDMTIVKEEIFGPVVTIQTFKTEEEAIAMANDTPYGLAGMVFTTDGARSLRVTKEIRAGIMWINCNQPAFNEAPWGGYKMSGIGRALGTYGLEEYQEVKQINIALNPGPVGWYENE